MIHTYITEALEKLNIVEDIEPSAINPREIPLHFIEITDIQNNPYGVAVIRAYDSDDDINQKAAKAVIPDEIESREEYAADYAEDDGYDDYDVWEDIFDYFNFTEITKEEVEKMLDSGELEFLVDERGAEVSLDELEGE